MFLRCPCGYTLTNIASPGAVAHKLLTERGVERLEEAVDREVSAAGSVESWPEHFEAAGAIETWVCPRCVRLFVHANGSPRSIIVYKRESAGLPDDAVGLDSQLGSERELIEMALREQAGESPLAAAGGGTCRNCGARTGQLHDPFCASELCPFCGDFITTCECIFKVLALSPAEREIVEAFEDDSVEPLKSICQRWHAAVEAKGRVPFRIRA